MLFKTIVYQLIVIVEQSIVVIKRWLCEFSYFLNCEKSHVSIVIIVKIRPITNLVEFGVPDLFLTSLHGLVHLNERYYTPRGKNDQDNMSVILLENNGKKSILVDNICFNWMALCLQK